VRSWLGEIRSAAHPSLLASALIVVGLLLIIAQLGWWLVFFQISSRERQIEQSRLDQSLLELARRGLIDATVERSGDDFRIRPAILEERERRRSGQQIMLLSETLAVVIVLSLIVYRSTKILRREVDLARERTAFLHSVTHELKTPLTTISLGLETLKLHDLSAAERQQILSDATQATVRLEDEINALLAASALLRKTVRIRDGEANIREVFKKILEQHNALIVRKNLSIETTFAMESVILTGIQPEFLQRALGSIVQNAIQYSGESSGIEIKVLKDLKWLSIQVSDRGPGLSRAERKKIFRPLYRGTHARPGGSGMGLAIARNIIEQAGGKILVTSDESAGGSTFTVRFPAQSLKGSQ